MTYLVRAKNKRLHLSNMLDHDLVVCMLDARATPFCRGDRKQRKQKRESIENLPNPLGGLVSMLLGL